MALTKIRGNTQILDGSIFDAQLAANAEIQTSKLAEGELFVKSDGTVAFTAPQVGVTPSLANHLTTKEYVDSVATGLDVKVSVRAISTTNITLDGEQTIDGVVLVGGDRVLVVGQTDASQNGIYVVNGDGVWARSEDADNSPSGEVTSGMFTFVEEGATQGGSGWVLTTANPIVLGTTDLVFAQFSMAGVIVAGAGLVKSGNVIDVVSASGGIVVNANDIALTLDGSSLSVGPAGLKISDMAEGAMLIGSASGVPTAHTMSGDVNMSSSGAATIQPSAVTTGKINDAAVTEDKLSTDSVSTDKIVDANVTESKLATDSVTTSKLADSNVTTEKLANAAVTEDKIDDQAVTQDKIANQAVGFNQLLTLGQAEIIIGTTNGNQAVTLSGDVTMTEAGVTSVNANTVVRVQDVITREVPVGALDGVNATFTLANTPKVGTEHVYYNGILQDPGASNDYVITGASIVFQFVPEIGTKIRVSYIK